MSPVVRILVGLGIIFFSFMGVWKTHLVVAMFGRNDWAERHLGIGHTKTFYKLVSFGLMMLGAIILTDLVDVMFGGIIRRVFGGGV